MPKKYAKMAWLYVCCFLETLPEKCHLRIVWKSVLVNHKHAKGCSKNLVVSAMTFRHLEHMSWSRSIYQYRSRFCLTNVSLVIFSEVRFQQCYASITWGKAATLFLVYGCNAA